MFTVLARALLVNNCRTARIRRLKRVPAEHQDAVIFPMQNGLQHNRTTMDRTLDNIYYAVMHADDLALQRCFNIGIFKAASEGVLTSTCVRANGIALKEALEEVIPACPDLGVGVHICLNEGSTVSPPSAVPLLSGADGQFRCQGVKGFVRLACSGENREMREQVSREMRLQIETLLKKLTLDHLNGHWHIHAIPWIFDIAISLAEEYSIPFIRLPREPFHCSTLRFNWPALSNFGHYINVSRWIRSLKIRLSRSKIRSNDYLYGLLHSSSMNDDVTNDLILKHKGPGIIEFLFHPAFINGIIEPGYTSHYLRDYCNDSNRTRELEALCSDRVRFGFESRGFRLTNYRNLATIPGQLHKNLCIY